MTGHSVHNVQDPFLNTLRRERVPVTVFLVNGVKLQGVISSFDNYCLLLKNNVTQLVFKHAVSTIMPSRNIVLPSEDSGFDNKTEIVSE